jgi:hypothetical protein
MLWPEWTEQEYLAYLNGERRRFAWVMRQHGGLTSAQADAAALEQYPYQTSDAPFRGLVFHDLAWHWAMRKLYGDLYWLAHPELARPPAAYRALR